MTMERRGYYPKKREKKREGGEGEEITRVRLPREDEMLGIVMGIMGGGRLQVSCKDGKERLCRIPGKIRRHIWVREGDIVIIKPWEIGADTKGDIVWRYSKLHADWLRDKGYLR